MWIKEKTMVYSVDLRNTCNVVYMSIAIELSSSIS